MKEMTPYPASLGSGSAHTGRPRFCCGRRFRPGPVTQAEGVSFPQHWPGPSPSPPHPGRRGAPLHPELSPLLLVMFLIT